MQVLTMAPSLPPQARQRFLEANEASMRAVHDRLSPQRVGLMRLQEAERKREEPAALNSASASARSFGPSRLVIAL